jgi:glycosyltransferase involved in cell wall biosynthesis
VLPARNEAGSLPRTVAEWAGALGPLTHEYEIIVVDDGSTDDTLAVVRTLGARYEGLRIVSHGHPIGYGAAVATGFAHAAHPWLFFTDADGQFDPGDFALLLEQRTAADIVVGYRRQRADPALRRWLSAGYNALARRLIGVSLRDINCAFKLMHRETFERLGIEASGFMFNAELAANARRAGVRIVEIAVHHRPRFAGASTVRPMDLLRSVYGLARLRMRRARRAARRV